MTDKTSQRYGRVSAEKIQQFIELWLDVVAHVARYAKSNRMVAKNVRTLYEMLPEVMDENGIVEFTELHGLLLLNGQPVMMSVAFDSVITTFLFVMLKHNIRCLRLQNGVTEADFFALLEWLAATESVAQNEASLPLPPFYGSFIAIDRQVDFAEQTPVPAPAPPAPPEKPAPPPIEPRNTAVDLQRPSAPVESLRLRVIVRVGPQALYGAEVRWADAPLHVFPTEGEEGALLPTPPGKRELLIRYDEYQIRKAVTVVDHNQREEIDLQTIFDYEGE